MKLLLAVWMLATTVVPGDRHLSAAMAHQDSVVPPPKPPADVAYGPINYGLQMAAWFDPERATVYCPIRTGAKASVRYCDYLVGNFEFVTVYARRSSTDAWLWIRRRQFPFEGVSLGRPDLGERPLAAERPGHAARAIWKHQLVRTSIGTPPHVRSESQELHVSGGLDRRRRVQDRPAHVQ
jgi:hypothetical protein